MPKTKLLLVEQSPDSQKEVGDLLESMGFICDRAATGPEALVLIRANDYAMIFLNFSTPEGLPAVKRMRDEGIEIMTAAFSNNPGPEDKEKCREFGVNQFLPQALNKSILEQLLKRWIPDDNWLG